MDSIKLREIKLVLAMLVVTTLLFSCKRPPEDPPVNSLSLSASSASVSFDAASTSVTVVAHADWSLTVEKDSDWITPDITRGGKNTTIKVTFSLSRNESESARTGKVYFYARDEMEPYSFSIIQGAKNSLSGVNKWIYEELSGWYYWNDVVRSTTPASDALPYDQFLKKTIESLPWSKVQDTSNGENPPTIDGQYKFDAGGNLVEPLTRGHVYSYIDRFPAADTRAVRGASKSVGTTFGFDIEPFRTGGTDDNPRLIFLVKWVMADSPAAKAGLERGMWITKYGGEEIFWEQYETFFYQLHNQQGGNTMTLTGEQGAEYSLTAVEMKLSPIIHKEIITTDGGKKVAYLVYNGFEAGDAQSGGTYEFDNDVRELFGEFKSGGASELVLDLRYNPGGSVNSLQMLTALAGDVKTTDVFLKLLRNKEIGAVYKGVQNPEVIHFRKESNSLALRKIYVLATGSSASSSEMFINSLRGVLGEGAVVHIGERTNGKNVGMDLRETTIGDYRYEMWPITFKGLNALDFTDFAAGFIPTLYKEEFWDVTTQGGSGVIHDFGTDRNGVVKERLLKASLDLIDGKTVQPDASTRAIPAAGMARSRVQGLRDPRAGGAKYIPDIE
jgi:hypothetical protein